MYRGVRYRVTCDELGAPLYTAEASYRLANAWWERKLASLQPQPNPVEVWHQRYQAMDLDEEIKRLRRELKAKEDMRFALIVPPALSEMEHEGIQKIIEIGKGADAVLREKEHVEPNFQLGHQIERFLTVEMARGKMPQTYTQLAYYLRRIDDCPLLPKTFDVREINESVVTDYWAWVRQCGALRTQRLRWGFFRRLVRFLWSERLIEMPRNLDSRLYQIEVPASKIKTYPIEEVRSVIAALSDRLRLYALLGLNCGMYSVDMGQLRHAEYSNGRIRRMRSKTRMHANVPEVEYLLWQETRELLDKYPSNHPEFVLTSSTGTPLWIAEVVNGKKHKTNLINQQWIRGKVTIPLKAFRSISATLLESHPEHARYTSHFLGHSAKSLKDKHYAAVSQERFDAALMWLRSAVLGNK
jgi:integrase